MAKEDLARAQAFQDRMNTLNAFANSYENKVAAKIYQEAEKGRQLAASQTLEKNRKDDEKERKKIEDRQKSMIQAKEFNQSIIERKRKEQEQDRIDAIMRRKEIEEQAALAKQKEKAAAEQRRAAALEMKAVLDRQISQKSKQDDATNGLSTIEMNMNKVRLALFLLYSF